MADDHNLNESEAPGESIGVPLSDALETGADVLPPVIIPGLDGPDTAPAVPRVPDVSTMPPAPSTPAVATDEGEVAPLDAGATVARVPEAPDAPAPPELPDLPDAPAPPELPDLPELPDFDAGAVLDDAPLAPPTAEMQVAPPEGSLEIDETPAPAVEIGEATVLVGSDDLSGAVPDISVPHVDGADVSVAAASPVPSGIEHEVPTYNLVAEADGSELAPMSTTLAGDAPLDEESVAAPEHNLFAAEVGATTSTVAGDADGAGPSASGADVDNTAWAASMSSRDDDAQRADSSDDAAALSGVRRALRTPSYLVLSLIGVAIALAAFLPWAGVSAPGASALDFAVDVTGVDAGGWGEAAIVVGAVIALLGLIGYFVNPFSDPEALFIVLFAGAALVAALVKAFDPGSLVDPDGTYPDAAANAAPGLWLVIAATAVCVVGGLAIVFSRRRIEE